MKAFYFPRRALSVVVSILFSIALTVARGDVVEPTIFYVATDGNDAAAGTNWVTAKQTIQAAVDLTVDGDSVIVSNGIYSTGKIGTPGYMVSNRVVITKSITVQSVNGPIVTGITGANNGDSVDSIRCVYISAGTLSGFTLTGGYAPNVNTAPQNRSGGGAYAVGGTLVNCIVTGNDAYFGGGGCYNGTLNNCVLTGNSAIFGGGAYQATLNNCTVVGNSAVLAAIGGGAYACDLNNSIVEFNSAAEGSNTYNCTANFSCTSPLPANGTGNITGDPKFLGGGGYQLSATSPCIDAGHTAAATGDTDAAGNPRVLYGVVDMGAYESTFPTGYWLWIGAVTNGETNLNDSATGDGFPNLLKYATGSSPTNSDIIANLSCALTTNGFTLHFNRNTNASDVTIIVEQSDAATNDAPWTAVATNAHGTWGASPGVSENAGGTPVAVSIDNTNGTNSFLRLRVTRP